MLTVSPTDRVFILAGAGVSAESGIPTFRGVGGLWRNYRIEEVASPEAWHRDPRLVWEFYSMRRRVAAAAKPNLRCNHQLQKALHVETRHQHNGPALRQNWIQRNIQSVDVVQRKKTHEHVIGREGIRIRPYQLKRSEEHTS